MGGDHGVPDQVPGRHLPVSGVMPQRHQPVGHVLTHGHLVHRLGAVAGRVLVRVGDIVDEPGDRVVDRWGLDETRQGCSYIRHSHIVIVTVDTSLVTVVIVDTISYTVRIVYK